MPDLITHVALSHLVRRPFDLTQKADTTAPFRFLFYLGTILPDILTRPWYILFPVSHDWTVFFHTPAGMLVTTGLLALFFESALRKKAFISISAGAGIHFLLDALQKKITGNDFWLFPFSWKSIGWGIAWADEFMDLVPLWIGLAAVLEIFVYFWERKHDRTDQHISPCRD